MRIVGRIAGAVVGIPFIWLGYDAVTAPGRRVELAAKLGVPRPEDAVRFNGAAMVVGGLGLLTGVQSRVAAVGLIAALVPTTAAGHAFWNDEDPQARKANRTQFLKNLGLAGGLLAIAVGSASSSDD